jgi:hypothetical protein
VFRKQAAKLQLRRFFYSPADQQESHNPANSSAFIAKYYRMLGFPERALLHSTANATIGD